MNVNMELVEKYGLAKYAGDADLSREFSKGFSGVIKAVQNSSNSKPPLGFNDHFTKGIGEAVGKGVGGVGLGLALHGLNKVVGAIGNTNLHTKYVAALEKAISMNPLLRETNKQELLSLGETIFKFAPHVAGDANVLSHILAHIVQADSGAGIDSMTLKTLGDLESRYIDNAGGGAGFSPKTYV